MAVTTGKRMTTTQPTLSRLSFCLSTKSSVLMSGSAPAAKGIHPDGKSTRYGHLSKVLEAAGYDVLSTDLIDRGYGKGDVDFLSYNGTFDGDIITNPPYKYAKEFVEHAIECVPDRHRVAMFLKIQFLEGKSRRELFDRYPPRVIYVASGRINCCKNGDFSKEQRSNNSAQAYAWFIWEKGYTGEPVVRWFN